MIYTLIQTRNSRDFSHAVRLRSKTIHNTGLDLALGYAHLIFCCVHLPLDLERSYLLSGTSFGDFHFLSWTTFAFRCNAS